MWMLAVMKRFYQNLRQFSFLIRKVEFYQHLQQKIKHPLTQYLHNSHLRHQPKISQNHMFHLQFNYEGWNQRYDHYGILKHRSTVSRSIYYLYSAENTALFCNYL